MKQKITAYLDNVITFLLLVVAGVTPLLFFNQTTEFYEIPKLIFLTVTTVVLLGLWIFSWILKGKVTITRTPLDIPLLFLLAVVIVSTIFSATKYPAIYGNFPNVHGSAVSWVVYILLYFVTVSQLRTLNKVKSFLYVLYGSATIITVISLMAFFKLFLPLDFAKAVNFTPTGATFSTIAFLLMLLPLPLLSLTKLNKYLPAPVALPLAILFSAVIVLTGSLPSYVLLLIVFGLCAFIAKPHKVKKTLGMFLIPVATTALVFAMAYLPLPGGLNVVQKLEANFPKEIQLPLATSWKISASVFRDAPFIGTGPSTYLFNFATYKPLEFNQLNIWSFSFDAANNEFLQELGTLGILGLLGLVFVCIVIAVNSWKNMFIKDSADSSSDDSHIMLNALAISGLASIGLLFVHATTIVSFVTSLFVIAALMMAQKSIREKVLEFSIGIKALTNNNKQIDLFPIVIFILFLVAAVPVLAKTYNVTLADYYHRMALSQANKNGTLTYQYLQKAEALNPEVDLYRVDMAQTNFALANALAIQKGPSKTSPSGTLTDQDKKTIQTLLSQAINEGRVAVTLSPRSARNWEVLASVYRNITGVAQNALAFSLDAYGNAIQRDPLNPALRVNVGGVYYSVKRYDLAARYFSDATNLKPDYANAYYNLAIAYRDGNDLQDAITVAQQLVTLLQKTPNSPDYKAASSFLADLKAKAKEAAANNPQTTTTTPATQGTSALQNNTVTGVNVPNLNNPPKVTVPSPVKSNPNAKIPQVSPIPTAQPVAPTTTP
jgi:O-antigen ligase/Flp pilus assembly protein TadD